MIKLRLFTGAFLHRMIEVRCKAHLKEALLDIGHLGVTYKQRVIPGGVMTVGRITYIDFYFKPKR